MLRFLSDENFNGDIVRGLLLHRADFNLVRVQDVALSGLDDPAVLAWAAENNRILLSHDRATMPDHAYARAAAGQSMPGVFIVSDRIPTGQVIKDLLLIDACSEQEEWSGLVLFLPL
jgi:predicted nuclease of predicted toxin-antitoxin system